MATELSTVQQGCLELPRHSCALGGALSAVSTIPGAIPILHAGAGCGATQLFGFRYGSGSQGVGYIGGMITPSTNVSEKEVVFGGENRLKEQIKATLDLIDGDLYVVITGCVPSMIGDDVGSVVKEFNHGSPPILYVNTPGYAANSFNGYERFLEAVIDQLLVKPSKTKKGLVNIFGIVPHQDLFWRGNLREIKRVLELLGLKANVLFGDFDGLNALKNLSSAELTVVVSPWVSIGAAKLLEEKFGVPYLVFPHLPVGPAETSRFLVKVGEKLKIPEDKLNKVLGNEERDTYQDLDSGGDITTMLSSSLPFVIVADSSYAVGITKFLANEAGFTPTRAIITDNPPEDVKENVRNELENLESGLKPDVFFEVDSYKIREILKKTYFRLILSSSMDKYIVDDLRVGQHLSIAFPTRDRLVISRSYAGYRGGSALLEDIISKFVLPM